MSRPLQLISFNYMQVISKVQAWQETANRMAKITDSLGKPVDAEIMDVVVALNAVGIHTTQSCEGHMDRGKPYPWIGVGAPRVEHLQQELGRLIQQCQTATEDYDALVKKARDIEQTLKRLHAQEEQKLVEYLDLFYYNHPLRYDRHLIIEHILGNQCLLRPQGSDIQSIRDTAERARKLAEYRYEMQAFAAFLKRRFFESVNLIGTNQTHSLVGKGR
jgi:hypothetical protein